MRFLDRAEPLDRRDLGITNRPYFSNAGARRPASNQHGACAALGQSAAELRAVECEIVTQNVEQRCIPIDFHRPTRTVDLEADDHSRLRATRRYLRMRGHPQNRSIRLSEYKPAD